MATAQDYELVLEAAERRAREILAEAHEYEALARRHRVRHYGSPDLDSPTKRTGHDAFAEETLDDHYRPLRAAIDAVRATIDVPPEVFAVTVAGRVEGLYVFVHSDDMEAFAQAVGTAATTDHVPLLDRDLAGELIAKERQDNTEEERQ